MLLFKNFSYYLLVVVTLIVSVRAVDCTEGSAVKIIFKKPTFLGLFKNKTLKSQKSKF